MKRFILLFSLFLWGGLIAAQSNFGGGGYEPPAVECVPVHEYERINSMLDANVQNLERQGILTSNRTEGSNYIWPIRQAEGFTYNSVYGVSNFVDHDPMYSGDNNDNITDYNCGLRSYDTESGYNHKGTDIFTWPFYWQMMQDDQVEIVAVADGTIIGKDDDNPDQSCNWDVNTGWNAVYIQHADGSRSWYGHMKAGSLTTKDVGEPVVQGEYLGQVGSSGISTGPHLHLELYDPDNQLIDPYVGTCNPTITESCWEEQRPYREPTLNAIFTHWDDPGFLNCPTPDQQVENHKKSNCFESGDRVYFASYFHDQMQGSVTNFQVFRPNGSTFKVWDHTSPATYTSSWWYWWYIIPLGSPEGTWTYEVTYQGETVSHSFTVGEVDAEPITGPLVSEVAEIVDYSVFDQADYTYDWTITGGSILSGQGEASIQIQWDDIDVMVGEVCVTATNPTGCSAEQECVIVELLPAGANTISGLEDWSVFPNPVQEQIHIQMEWSQKDKIQVQLYTPLGQVVRALSEQDIAPGTTNLSIDVADLPAGIYLLTLQRAQEVVTRRIVVH